MKAKIYFFKECLYRVVWLILARLEENNVFFPLFAGLIMSATLNLISFQ
jgi:hypothetical protein